MAENKKTVLLYCDLIHTIEKLTDGQAGLLFKHFLRYVNDLDPKTDDKLIDIVFEPIKQQLKRDLKKWENRAETSRNNGQLGGRPKKPKKPSGLNENLDEPKKPVTVKDTVTVNVTDKDIKDSYRDFFSFWNLYNKKVGKKKVEAKWHKLNKETRELILQKLPAYISSTPDPQYRKNPLTYLNNESWNDEIITKANDAEVIKAPAITYTQKEIDEINQIKRAYEKQKAE